MRRRVVAVAIAVAGLMTGSAVGATFAAASTTAATTSSTASAYANRLVQLVNQARTSHGMSALTIAGGTSEVALGWTAHLARSSSLAHNPDLGPQLEAHGSPNWTTYGENVGAAPTADQLFRDYMQSPEHRANILESRYRYLGVGVDSSGGTTYNTLDFVDSYGSAAPRSTQLTVAPTLHRRAAPAVLRPSSVRRVVTAQRNATAPHHAAPHHATAGPAFATFAPGRVTSPETPLAAQPVAATTTGPAYPGGFMLRLIGVLVLLLGLLVRLRAIRRLPVVSPAL